MHICIYETRLHSLVSTVSKAMAVFKRENEEVNSAR